MATQNNNVYVLKIKYEMDQKISAKVCLKRGKEIGPGIRKKMGMVILRII